MANGRTAPGYAFAAGLGRSDSLDLLTPDGEHQAIPLSSVRCVYFVADFDQPAEPARKVFLSRPKLKGLWLLLAFRDGEELEGICPNDMLDLLENGIQITPPDLFGNCQRVFAPRSALAGVTVLGVVGAIRRGAKHAAPAMVAQGEFFDTR